MNACRRIGLTYNLRKDFELGAGSPEDAAGEFDSEETIASLEGAIRSFGFETVRIGEGRRIPEAVPNGNIDLVFNIAEGYHGRSREAQVPALLEMLDVPYTFSDPLSTALCHDKAMAKLVLQASGVATTPWLVADGPEAAARWVHGFPAFVKPLHEGTAKGITTASRVRSASELRERVRAVLEGYRQPALVEPYLPGREFTVGILEWPEPRAIGLVEVVVKEAGHEGIYTFVAKEKCEEQVAYIQPTDAGSALVGEVMDLGLRSFLALQCRDAVRVDVRLDAAGRPQVLELNPLPGLNPSHSDLPILAEQSGMSYRELIGAILRSALGRAGLAAP